MAQEDRSLRVFLCHSSGDKPIVRDLYRRLGAEGWIDAWLDAEKLLPGQEWDIEIEKAVEQSDAVIVFLSSHSVDKAGYIQKELRFVLNIADEKPEGTIFVIPLRLDNCLVPRRLRNWQYVDYFPKVQRKIAYQRLLDSLKLRASRLGISTTNLAQEKTGDGAKEAPNQPQPATSKPEVQEKQEYRSRPSVPPRSESVVSAKTSVTPAALETKLTVLQGIGPQHAERLGQLGLHTLGDMLYYYPQRYYDYSQLKALKDISFGEQVTVIGTIQSVHSRPIQGGGVTTIEVIISDGTAGLRLSFFNQPWLANRFKAGDAIYVSGKVDQYLGRLVMNSPDWEPVEVESLHTNGIIPVYSLRERITQKWIRNVMKQVVEYWAPRVVDALPESTRSSARLLKLPEALMNVHFPNSQAKLKDARERLAFDEIFYFELGVLRQQSDSASGLHMVNITDELIEKARVQAQNLFEQDPDLSQPEHALLAEAFERFWGNRRGNVGEFDS